MGQDLTGGRLVGKITHYFGKPGVGVVELTDRLRIGDTIRITGAKTDFTQVVESMQIEHQPVEEAGPGDCIGLKVLGRVHEGDRVYAL
ncbi:MAG: hypothetical protein ACUVX8_04700 [Candidatus Zipacnadales bacterium]